MTGPGDRSGLEARDLLGVRLDATSYSDATRRVLAWAGEGGARYVCAANVHMLMEAHDSPEFRDVVNGASLVTPDGMPLVWAMRRMGLPHQQRVYGPDLTLWVCDAAARQGVPVGFLGGRPEVLSALLRRLGDRFAGLKVAYAHSPPFRPASSDEEEARRAEILCSGARILFVGLGCPTQERWMAHHCSRLPLVMLGVGAAFDFISGAVPQAPGWMQAASLEWLFRMRTDPARLARRYLKHNPRFLALAGWELLKRRGGR